MPANIDRIRCGQGESHPWDLNPQPNAYEAFALPLS